MRTAYPCLSHSREVSASDWDTGVVRTIDSKRVRPATADLDDLLSLQRGNLAQVPLALNATLYIS